MTDNYDYHNSRNVPADTYDRLSVESAMPFVSPDPVFHDADRGITLAGDAAFHATPLDMCVQADGDTTTRAKYGPSNRGGDTSLDGGGA